MGKVASQVKLAFKKKACAWNIVEVTKVTCESENSAPKLIKET